MTTCLRTTIASLLFVLVVGPAWAQSDNGGVVPMSDGSGVLTQSDQVFIQSDEVRIRLNEIASKLAEAVRDRTLGPSVKGGQQSMRVPEGLAQTLLNESRRNGQRALAKALTDRAVPTAEANALAETMSGLLSGHVDLKKFNASLHAFNAVVNAAPASFLAQPPAEFMVARAVLMTLLDGAITP